MATLYIVATPIGNLKDITLRALEVLNHVQLVAAEDTRVAKKLFAAHGISAELISYHQHNANQRDSQLVSMLCEGKDIALVTDAGTPLISDPGHSLVALCREHEIDVIPVPGVSALTTALSVNDFSISRFCFEGFLPPKHSARRQKLKQLCTSPYATVLYEAKHRIVDFLQDIESVFGPHRRIMVARELTKLHEQCVSGEVQEIIAKFKNELIPCKGEFVVILEADDGSEQIQAELQNVRSLFEKLAGVVSHKDAVDLAKSISSLPKNTLYDLASEYYQSE